MANATETVVERELVIAAKPETTPKQMTGVAARMEIVAPDRRRLACSSGKTGGRLVIEPRRL